ncbi:MAG: hypothetical protein HN580_28070 [Deltaproteobacteria bacterium]|jgi:hypothetical protein|nr:hypothetical protein [Deltaproteobacteria bacterium]MBT4262777.1 hypothetical protein [Deltaproteobacteria bacterium]MBT4637294.1 hypothetical protein [Deltaproteobacteria bacterium]MBT6504338.1 hypothetical protein [Deltaproteobacteria bacterium]MBT6614530.1 hypothetical protein [Deltaproteobacteria bacterium]
MLEGFTQKSKKTLFVLAVFLIVAIVINLVILELFNQKSFYRAAHSLIGIIALMGFVYTFADDNISRAKLFSIFLISLVPCYLGTVFSDLDIRLLGIGGHRNPLFHSGLLFFFFFVLAKRFNSYLLAVIVAAFGVGLGSHLIWDIFDHADVRWIPGGSLDRLWLGINGLICFLLARLFLSSRLRES